MATEEPKFLFDPYLDWVGKEGLPVFEGLGIDLLQIETGPWPRFGVDAACAHLEGRGDFVAIFVIDLPPGGQSAPQRHLFEEVVYVLDGHGSTTLTTADGQVHSFEWGSEEPLRAAAERAVPALQRQRARPRAARLDP